MQIAGKFDPQDDLMYEGRTPYLSQMRNQAAARGSDVVSESEEQSEITDAEAIRASGQFEVENDGDSPFRVFQDFNPQNIGWRKIKISQIAGQQQHSIQFIFGGLPWQSFDLRPHCIVSLERVDTQKKNKYIRLAQLDTGSNLSFISTSLARRAKLRERGRIFLNRGLEHGNYGVGGHVYGYARVRLTFENWLSVDANVLVRSVAQQGVHISIGTDIFASLSTICNPQFVLRDQQQPLKQSIDLNESHNVDQKEFEINDQQEQVQGRLNDDVVRQNSLKAINTSIEVIFRQYNVNDEGSPGFRLQYTSQRQSDNQRSFIKERMNNTQIKKKKKKKKAKYNDEDVNAIDDTGRIIDNENEQEKKMKKKVKKGNKKRKMNRQIHYEQGFADWVDSGEDLTYINYPGLTDDQMKQDEDDGILEYFANEYIPIGQGDQLIDEDMPEEVDREHNQEEGEQEDDDEEEIRRRRLADRRNRWAKPS
ncbi:MAG: hypothetical protein EZS28_020868 [Streblomastix strix]|uniref:Uncharacterized protein n=1 Tax=Streblomastix strix TaxID=222440 RepID=A0A5J4VLT4_9EUKA|nr:MAG: hypothetical protein EZS28_020868 [Streblomastix strix]